MTLIVSLVNTKIAVLVADRRVSQNGVALDDEYNKVTVIFCVDARLVVAFTGVATLPGFDAARWIAESLHSIVNETSSVHDVLERFRLRLSERFRTLTAPDLRFTVVFCGFVYWTSEPEPRNYLVSNFEAGEYNPTTFTTRSVGSPGAKILEVAGTTAPLAEKTKDRLRALLDLDLPGSNLVRFAVKHIQNCSSASNSLGTIGQQCNAAVVLAQVDTPITTTYHTARNANRAFGPNIVDLGSPLILGSEIMGPGILAGPDIRKRDPCWCGSGVAFKHCHLQKYGSVYLRHPAWSRPLVSVFRAQRKENTPAGRLFCVQGGFE